MIIPSNNFKSQPANGYQFLGENRCKPAFAITSISGLYTNSIVLLWLVFFLFSCKEQIPEYYSSDPGINEYVKLKKTELADIPVETLLSYDLLVQRAIFSSWTPEKKSDAWRYRLGRILSESDFNPQEFIHMQRLIDSVSPELFLIPDNGNESFLTFKSEWINY